jgi:hypothetical protein
LNAWATEAKPHSQPPQATLPDQSPTPLQHLGRRRIPDQIVDEVVSELYGGWTDQARNYVKVIEERDRGVV